MIRSKQRVTILLRKLTFSIVLGFSLTISELAFANESNHFNNLLSRERRLEFAEAQLLVGNARLVSRQPRNTTIIDAYAQNCRESDGLTHSHPGPISYCDMFVKFSNGEIAKVLGGSPMYYEAEIIAAYVARLNSLNPLLRRTRYIVLSERTNIYKHYSAEGNLLGFTQSLDMNFTVPSRNGN